MRADANHATEQRCEKNQNCEPLAHRLAETILSDSMTVKVKA